MMHLKFVHSYKVEEPMSETAPFLTDISKGAKERGDLS